MINLQRLLLTLAALIFAASYSVGAHAEIFLSVTDGTHTGSANDSSTPGQTEYSGTIGNFTTTINAGFGYPAEGSPADPVLDLTSADLTTGTAGGTLTVSLTETGFTTTTADLGFLSSITGNYFGSSAVMDTYFDPSDTPFGTAFSLAAGLVDNQSAAVAVPPIDGPYSLTEIITVTAGANSLTSLDASLSVPEPGSLSIVGIGLLALGLLGLRRFAFAGADARATIE
jgi:hypothetical protein